MFHVACGYKQTKTDLLNLGQEVPHHKLMSANTHSWSPFDVPSDALWPRFHGYQSSQTSARRPSTIWVGSKFKFLCTGEQNSGMSGMCVCCTIWCDSSHYVIWNSLRLRYNVIGQCYYILAQCQHCVLIAGLWCIKSECADSDIHKALSKHQH